MSKVPDAWDDDWSSAVDTTTPPTNQTEPKKLSSKVSKAQRRAQQAEFNRQLWAEAEGPKEPNYFLESRNIIPLRTEYKPPAVLLSRKGPPIVRSIKPPTDALDNLTLLNNKGAESSEDEDEIKAREQTLAERQAQAAKDREEKQRKYEERRMELFGAPSASAVTVNGGARGNSQSGTSTPNSLTPPGSRSATPSRGRGRGRGWRGGVVGGGGGVGAGGNGGQQTSTRQQQQQQQSRREELFDPGYSFRPEVMQAQRRDGPQVASRLGEQSQQQRPVRGPKGPDGSGRGGFGFAGTRGARQGGEVAASTVEGVSAT